MPTSIKPPLPKPGDPLGLAEIQLLIMSRDAVAVAQTTLRLARKRLRTVETHLGDRVKKGAR